MAGNWYHGSISGGGASIRFYYNPETIRIIKSTDWAQLRAAGREQPILQYGCGSPIIVKFDILIRRKPGDDYGKNLVQSLLRLTKPTVRGAGVDRPPIVTLDLGEAIRLQSCIIARVEPELGPLFSPDDLTPYLGKVHVEIWEAKDV